MKKLWAVMIFSGVLILGLGALADAEIFTLADYNVTLRTVDPGLVLYWNPILPEPKSWDLTEGQNTGWFDFFRICTTEGSVNWLPPEDTVHYPISVSFTWTAPPGTAPDSVNGETWGWWFIIDGGKVEWSDSPAVFNFGTGGQFTFALKDGEFCVPGSTIIKAKLTYVDASAAVPEPATMVLSGLGLVGLAGYGRKKFKK